MPCPVWEGDGLMVPVVLQHDMMQKTLALPLEKISLERRGTPVADMRR